MKTTSSFRDSFACYCKTKASTEKRPSQKRFNKKPKTIKIRNNNNNLKKRKYHELELTMVKKSGSPSKKQRISLSNNNNEITIDYQRQYDSTVITNLEKHQMRSIMSPNVLWVPLMMPTKPARYGGKATMSNPEQTENIHPINNEELLEQLETLETTKHPIPTRTVTSKKCYAPQEQSNEAESVFPLHQLPATPVVSDDIQNAQTESPSTKLILSVDSQMSLFKDYSQKAVSCSQSQTNDPQIKDDFEKLCNKTLPYKDDEDNNDNYKDVQIWIKQLSSIIRDDGESKKVNTDASCQLFENNMDRLIEKSCQSVEGKFLLTIYFQKIIDSINN